MSKQFGLQEAQDLAKRLNGAYHRTISPSSLQGWLDALTGLDAGAVFDAWAKWVREQKRAPVPADIVALVRGSGSPLDTRGAHGPRGCQRCRWSGWRYVALEVVDEWGARCVLAGTQCECDKGRSQGTAPPATSSAYTSSRQVMDLDWSLPGLQVAQGCPDRGPVDPETAPGLLADLIRGIRGLARAARPQPEAGRSIE